jgi:hypothetical protein
MDLAEQRQVWIAYIALCELKELVEDDLGDERDELSAARRHLRSLLKPEETSGASDAHDGWSAAHQPFDNFAAAPRDLQDRLVLEAIGDHRRTSMQIHDAMQAESPDCRVSGDLRKRLDRLVAAGELDREPWKEGPCRYRWFRRVPDMAELEQAFEAAA